MNDVVNSLKRLERFGSEQGKAINKIRDAVKHVSFFLVYMIHVPVGNGVCLPRGYFFEQEPGIGTAVHFCKSIDGHDTILDWESTEEKYLLMFAQDIATGWLDEVADWCEKYRKEIFQEKIDAIEKLNNERENALPNTIE